MFIVKKNESGFMKVGDLLFFGVESLQEMFEPLLIKELDDGCVLIFNWYDEKIWNDEKMDNLRSVSQVKVLFEVWYETHM